MALISRSHFFLILPLSTWHLSSCRHLGVGAAFPLVVCAVPRAGPCRRAGCSTIDHGRNSSRRDGEQAWSWAFRLGLHFILGAGVLSRSDVWFSSVLYAHRNFQKGVTFPLSLLVLVFHQPASLHQEGWRFVKLLLPWPPHRNKWRWH